MQYFQLDRIGLSDIRHHSLRRFEKGQSWKLQRSCQPAACLRASQGEKPDKQQRQWKIWNSPFLPWPDWHHDSPNNSNEFSLVCSRTCFPSTPPAPPVIFLLFLYNVFSHNPDWFCTAHPCRMRAVDHIFLLVSQVFGLGESDGPGDTLSCLLLGQQSVSRPRPSCLQGLRLAFIPRSAAKANTPPGHEERGMHSDPPPSSPLSLQRSRDGGPFVESNQDPRHQLSLFFIVLFTLLLFFLSPLCEDCLQW